MLAGRDNSSHNHVVARIRGNTLERHEIGGIETSAAIGAAVFPTGPSNHNVLDIRIERNTVRSQTGEGIFVGGADGINDGGVANGNHTTAVVMYNTVEDNTYSGIDFAAGGIGQASGNTLEVQVAHNTVCNTAGADIFGEGGYSGGNSLFPVPNLGIGNVLTGKIFHNTATVVVQDGTQNGTPENTADVRQFKNDPCP